MIATPAPTSQKAGVRPIYFMLDNAGVLSNPVSLTIRPEDLTRTEPTRAAVHQTLGRDVQGWVDNFGRGLPTVNISGHTGWRHSLGTGMDGAQAFEALNQLVTHEYAAAVQEAINSGMDPAAVQLLFIDTLDQFAYSVVPMQFTLRRSKSRPLLYQYSIVLQATADTAEVPVLNAPFTPSVPAALNALDDNLSFFTGNLGNIDGWLRDVFSQVDGSLLSATSSLSGFFSSSASVFGQLRSNLSGASDLATSRMHRMIDVAQQMASSGVNVFHAVNAIGSSYGPSKARISTVSGAYNETLCLLQNALRPRQVYEEYSPLYGSSNCSSTTGGRPPSPLQGVNVFAEMVSGSDNLVRVSGSAVGALKQLASMDPVLSPMPLTEVARLVDVVVEGVSV